MTTIELDPDRFYLGQVSTFLNLIKTLGHDPEFRIAFDFGKECVDLESMMMAGVVGVGIKFNKVPNGVFVPSPTTRRDRLTFRIDSVTFLKVLSTLGKLPYAYMSFHVVEDSILVQSYNCTHQVLGSASIHTINMEENDEDFVVVGGKVCESLEYPVSITALGSQWKKYLQSSSNDTTLRYNSRLNKISWETKDVLSKVSLYLPVENQNTYHEDVTVTFLPAVIQIIRGLFLDRQHTTISMSEELPLRSLTTMDHECGFIRVYAGSKET